jgi:F-type H+-transporting ATPase subunit epsilon
MAEKMINLEIITPEEIKYKGQAKLIIAPGSLGSLGILPGHAPLISPLEKGKLMIRSEENKDLYMNTGEGLIEVKANNVSILVDYIEEI